jgi:hypothetical protein
MKHVKHHLTHINFVETIRNSSHFTIRYSLTEYCPTFIKHCPTFVTHYSTSITYCSTFVIHYSTSITQCLHDHNSLPHDNNTYRRIDLGDTHIALSLNTSET